MDKLFKMKKIVLLAFVSVLLSTAMVATFIEPVVSRATIYIRADGSVEGTDKIQRDGNVYTFTDNINDSIVVERDNIMINGTGYTLEGTGAFVSRGIDLTGRSNVTIKNTEIKAFWYGIWLEESSSNSISGNNITNNEYGIWLNHSSSNIICHNNFVDNTEQVHSLNSTNVWDNGYPSGGNYWSDYIDLDQYSGPYQNETGNDGIWDHTYVIDENNQDHYPIVARGRVYDGIYFPLGDKSFADEVVDFKLGEDTVSPHNNSQSAVGPPDYTDDENYVALGHGGILTVKFTDNYLIDVDGADLYVFEIGGAVEPFKVEISEDGSNWIDLGTVSGQPTSLDIHSKVAPGDEFRYVRITDANSHMSGSPYAGADIDAVGAIGAKESIPPPTIHILSPENKTFYSENNVSLTITVDKPIDWMGYSLNGQMNVTTSGNTTLTSLVDGLYYVIVYANDTAGNMEASDTIWFWVDITPPNVTYVSQTPPKDNVLPEDKVEVYAGVTENLALRQMVLSYTTNNGTWFTIPMTLHEAGYNATIPRFPHCTTVTYIIIAEDDATNTVTTEELGYDTQYHVIARDNPPYQPQLSIAPSLAVEDNDDLIVTAIGPTPADPDGDTVTYTYRWLVDVGTGEFLDDELAGRGDHAGNMVPAADTVVGDVWRVEVTPVDEHGAVGPKVIATWQVVVDATKPVADAGLDQTVVEDIVVSFDAGGSSDNVGIVSYEWDFGDGTTVTGLTVNHTYAEPGIYNVTLTVTDATGYEDTHSITVTVLPTEPIREPRSVHVVAEVAVAGAAVTATTAAIASLGGLGQSFNSAVSKLPIPDELKEFLRLYGEKIFETVDKVKLEALEKAPFITKGELVALGISALVTTIVFSFVEANGLPSFLDPSVLVAVIPSTLLSVCMMSIAGELSEALCARTCRVYRQYRLWMYGLGAFLISGLLFLFPFSSPGITRYQSGEISNKTKGLIILSKMLILLTLTIPFAGLSMLGFKIIGDAGLLLTLMTVCYSLVPLKPLAGKAVFDYRKEVSLIALVSAGILFQSYTFNLLPHVTYLAVGVVSVFLAAITLIQLRKAHPK